MPLQDHMRLISTDDHVVEHPRVWLDRLPAALRDRGPRLVEVTGDMVRTGLSVPSKGGNPVPVGAEVWLLDGQVHPTITTNAIAGRPREEYGFEPFRLDQVRPGCYDPIAPRWRTWTLDGVQAQLLGVPVPSPASPAPSSSRWEDKELALACVQAYNDFMIEEWCASAPRTRLHPARHPPVVGRRRIEACELRAHGSTKRRQEPWPSPRASPARPAVDLHRTVGPRV